MSKAGLLCLVVAACAAIGLCGCGGGGGTTGVAPPSVASGYGCITGNVSEVLGSQMTTLAASSVTVGVEGTDLSTQANPDGSFVLEHVPSGFHTLVAHTNSRAAALVITVESSRETNVGEIVLQQAGQITGVVTSQTSGEPIPDALVTVIESVMTVEGQMPHPVRTQRTAANGSYAITGLPAGDYAVTITKDSYDSTSLYVTVTASAAVAGDASLKPAASSSVGTVRGTVYASTQDGCKMALPGVLVRLAQPEDPILLLPVPAADDDGIDSPPPPPYAATKMAARGASLRDYYAFTGTDGTYSIDGIPAGAYVAVALRPGLEMGQQPVTVTAGQSATIGFTLALPRPTTGVIEGTVSDSATGKPIVGAKVVAVVDSPASSSGFATARSGASKLDRGSIITPDPSETVMETQTNSQGHYTLIVPDAVAAVRFRAEGYQADELDVTVQPGGAVSLDASLTPEPPATVRLTGRVLTGPEGAREPVVGAEVYAVPQSGVGESATLPVTGYTDAEGWYQLDVYPGYYELSARKPNMTSETVVFHVTGDTTRNISMQEDLAPPPPPPF